MTNQLFLMREGVRKVEAMESFVKELKDDEMEALAKYYAAQPPKPSDEPIDQDLSKRGAELAPRMRCTSCHGPILRGRSRCRASPSSGSTI